MPGDNGIGALVGEAFFAQLSTLIPPSFGRLSLLCLLHDGMTRVYGWGVSNGLGLVAFVAFPRRSLQLAVS
jgi:hypothetical protein